MAYFSKGALFGSVHLVLDICLHMVMEENRYIDSERYLSEKTMLVVPCGVPCVRLSVVSAPSCPTSVVFTCAVYRHWKRANLPEGCDEFEREQD